MMGRGAVPPVLAAAGARAFKRLSGRSQWLALWLRHHKFIVGVSGVVFDRDGSVLLLKHRYWVGDPCGLPSGYANRGETWQQALAREVAEETGLHVSNIVLLSTRAGFRLRVEVCLAAEVAESAGMRLDHAEILEARFVPPDQLPDGLRSSHREAIQQALATRPAAS